ncbi:GNAT family N-acetyltransferase [Oxalicibacterium solurbis]|uniref:Acetyltransferase n=1 Tax=Oxalicibacterium solurbis TaxID=69280 RepID=A0A8J3F4V5_9BURK|nr:GNAT family N-acetyltransferase [Oxalicibacterium solurbis]GGI52903.1 acetyltransferase [Oxalicibacterium solurbis]
MLIRPFEVSDADVLADIFHASVREIGIRDYSLEQVEAWSPSKPDPKRYLQQAQGRTLLVAVDDDGRIIGYGDLEPNGHIDHLYCCPDVVGTGVGSAIYAALENAARSVGIVSLFVEASEAARCFFECRGFRVDTLNNFTINGVAIHNYSMSKHID